MSVEQNKALARRWLDEVWSKGNLTIVDEDFAPEFTFNYADPGVSSDREGYKKTVNAWRTTFANMTFTLDDIVAEGNKVAIRWTGRSTHKGEFMGIAPTGKQTTGTGVSFLRVAGGKVVEEWSEWDMLSLLQQIGAFPPPGSE